MCHWKMAFTINTLTEGTVNTVYEIFILYHNKEIYSNSQNKNSISFSNWKLCMDLHNFWPYDMDIFHSVNIMKVHAQVYATGYWIFGLLIPEHFLNLFGRQENTSVKPYMVMYYYIIQVNLNFHSILTLWCV